MNKTLVQELSKLKHISVVDEDSYKDLRTAIKFSCEKHGDFMANPVSIYTTLYHGCNGCKLEATGREFIQKAKNLHKDKYEYFLEDYKCSRTKTKIRCKKHDHIFYQRPSAHLQGQGCDICGKENTNKTKALKGFPKFIHEAVNLYGDTYDYSKVDFKTTKTDVKIICKTHGEFYTSPDKHISHNGICPVCKTESTISEKTKIFIDKLEKIRPDKFDTSKVVYIRNTEKVKLRCKEHDEWFEQTPLKMLDPKRSPSCGTCFKLSLNRWSIDSVSKIPNIEDKRGFTYIGKISDMEGIKVGVCENLEVRLKSYNRDLEQHGKEFEYCYHKPSGYMENFIAESVIKDVFKDFRRFGDVWFGGYTEMYDECIKDQVVSCINTVFEYENLGDIYSHKDGYYKDLVDLCKHIYLDDF